MSLLEIHFHDSGFSLFGDSGESNGTASKLRSRASEAASGDSDGDGDGADTALGKLAMFGAVALVVTAGVAYNRVRRRRARVSGEKRSSERRSVSSAE